MAIDTTHRSIAFENMDDFDLEGKDIRDSLDRLAQINRYLGGNHITLQGVKSLLNDSSIKRDISIIDMGCGNGDLLRIVAAFGLKNKLILKLTGVDANEHTLNYARSLSMDYPNIDYLKMDITGEEFLSIKADIFLCTLTLHHFNDKEILKILSNLKANANVGIVVNDLQRSALSYRLFQVVCFVFGLNAISREDGLLSILKGFKKKELIAFSKQIGLRSTIKWKWAFRYQWIISNV